MDHVLYLLLAALHFLPVCYLIFTCVNSKKKCKPSSGKQGKTPGEHGSEPMSHSLNPHNDPHTAITVDNPTDQPQNMHQHNLDPSVLNSSAQSVSQRGSTGPYGLINQGSTCYLNSVLQVLFNTREIRQALNKTNQGLNDTDRVLQDLFKNLKKQECDTKRITKDLQIKDVYKQRDAREHLELLLNRMSPAVSKPFLGEQLYRTTCSKGHCIIEEPYPFWTLPLTVSENSSVQESLDDMDKSEDFSFYCPECKEDITATRVCEMTKPPEILTLLLKWSHNDQHTIYNYSNEVQITVAQVEKPVLYSLCGVVDHSGSRRGGHYTATLLNSDDGHWYCFNDSYVHKFNWQDDKPNHRSSTAYLLIYRENKIPSKRNKQNDYVELPDDSNVDDSPTQLHRGSNSTCVQSDQSARNDGDSMELQPSQDQNQATVDSKEFMPSNISEDEALKEAIRRSFLDNPKQPSQDSKSAKLTKEEVTGILKAHSKKVVSEDFRQIYICRGNVWKTALDHFIRPTFIESRGMLNVTFSSDKKQEEAEDLVGPRQEFFRLLIKAIFKESGAFEESPKGFIPRLNYSHLKNEVYRVIGQMLSTIIVQGGEPPALLAPCVVDLLLTGDIFKVDITLEDLGDQEMRDALNKVDQASTEDDLKKALKACNSWKYKIDGLPTVTMENKNDFVKNAIHRHVLLQRESCYNQLAEGLNYYEMLPLFKEKPGLRLLLEMPKGDVTADDVALLKATNSRRK